MKCYKSGSLLCCSSSICSVAYHRDCLGVEPRFDDSGSFRCPFCASSSETAEYLEAERRAAIRKRELDDYLSSSLSSKLPRLNQNKKNRISSKQGGMSYPMEGQYDQEKAETDRNQPNQIDAHRDHISLDVNGEADVNPAPESSVAGMDSSSPEREMNDKTTRHGDNDVIVEPQILQAEDILPLGGKNTAGDSTTCQPLLMHTSEETEHQNSYAIVPYEGNKVCDKKDSISQNNPETTSKYVRPVRNIPKIMISKATSNL